MMAAYESLVAGTVQQGLQEQVATVDLNVKQERDDHSSPTWIAVLSIQDSHRLKPKATSEQRLKMAVRRKIQRNAM